IAIVNDASGTGASRHTSGSPAQPHGRSLHPYHERDGPMTPAAPPRSAFRRRRRAPAGAGWTRAWPGVVALTATALAAPPALAHTPAGGVGVLPALGGPRHPP